MTATLSAEDLDLMTTAISHCDRPMRYRNSLTSWEGKPGEGAEITSTTRVCECGAELTVTLRRPS